MELTFESRASNDLWEVVHTELFDTRSFSWLISVLTIVLSLMKTPRTYMIYHALGKIADLVWPNGRCCYFIGGQSLSEWGTLKYDKVPFFVSKVCEGSLSRDLFSIHLLYDLNSHGTERGKCVVKTLHEEFFLSSSLLSNGPVAVNESGLKLKFRWNWNWSMIRARSRQKLPYKSESTVPLRIKKNHIVGFPSWVKTLPVWNIESNFFHFLKKWYFECVLSLGFSWSSF